MQGFSNRLLHCQVIQNDHNELVIGSQVWIGLLFFTGLWATTGLEITIGLIGQKLNDLHCDV